MRRQCSSARRDARPRVVVRRARARAGRAALLVPQHVRGRGRERGAVALQVVRQGGVQPLAPLPLAHGAALALPLLPRHLQPHRHAALALAAQARRAAAQTLSIDSHTNAPDPCSYHLSKTSLFLVKCQ